MSAQHPAIPVLMYHHVNPAGSFINVMPQTFELQMRYLKEKGFTALHAGEFSGILSGKAAAPRKPVMITFDDGWLDNWVFAYPVLKRYGMKAVVFLITSRVSQEEKRRRSDEGRTEALPTHRESAAIVESGRADEVMLSWDEVTAMKDSGLIEFHSHTHTHQRWDKLLPDRNGRNDALRNDLQAAKEILEKKGHGGSCLCWPQGFYDDDYLQIAGSLGYRMLFTTKPGTNTTSSDMKEIKRIVIGDIGAFSLAKKLFIYSRPALSRAYLKYFK
jgi:peptidoglycan/xylan/chitin deacetylase (PgdA/CDA1 family)